MSHETGERQFVPMHSCQPAKSATPPHVQTPDSSQDVLARNMRGTSRQHALPAACYQRSELAMSLLAAMNTAISGLGAQSDAFGNISDNVANSQTVGYKRADTAFTDFLTSLDYARCAPGGGVLTHWRVGTRRLLALGKARRLRRWGLLGTGGCWASAPRLRRASAPAWSAPERRSAGSASHSGGGSAAFASAPRPRRRV